MSKAAELASLASASETALSNRNIIINGAMQVAQRATSATGITGAGYHALDRWNADLQSAGTHTLSQSTDGPSGFKNSLKNLVTSADASLAAGDRHAFQYYIEAQDLQQLDYGASTAKTITLSFYVKSNVTGTYSAELMQPDNSNKHYAFTYSISSADTWTKITKTIVGDTGGVINNDTGSGLLVKWYLDAGSNFTSGTYTANVWQTRTLANVVKSDSVNFCNSVNNEWYITGVQLELGPVATPFEHRSVGQEMALCQRYYYKKERLSYPGATIGHATAGPNLVAGVDFPVTMRATPTVVIYDREGTSNSIINVGNNTVLGYTPSQVWWTEYGIASFTGTDALTANSIQYGYNFTADIEL